MILSLLILAFPETPLALSSFIYLFTRYCCKMVLDIYLLVYVLGICTSVYLSM